MIDYPIESTPRTEARVGCAATRGHELERSLLCQVGRSQSLLG
jgi:hypothetical protein